MIGKRGNKYFAKLYVNGKQVWCGTHDTRKEAKAAIKKYEREQRPQKEETCDRFAKQWVRNYPRNAPGTVQVYASAARRFAKDFEGVRLSDVHRLRAREWALDAPPSVVAAVRTMFWDALNDGLVLSNPFTGMRIAGSRGRQDIVALSAEDVERLADAAHKVYPEYPDLPALILTAAYTGMRAGELCALEWADIDFDRNLINVQRAYDRLGNLGLPKKGSTGTIRMFPIAREALLSVPRRIGSVEIGGGSLTRDTKEGTGRSQSPRPSGPDTASNLSRLVFHSPSGKTLRVNEINVYMRKIRKEFGREDITFHWLRHTCATMLVEQGFEAWVVARQLRHKDGGALVTRLYGHPTADLAMESLGRAFAPKPVAIASQREENTA